MDRDDTVRLLCAILAGIPRLPGAACRGRHELYNEIPGRPSRDQRRERFEAAVTVCSFCPVQARCPSPCADPAASRLRK